MAYNSVVETGGHRGKETKTDIKRFAADLAKALGGKVLPPSVDWQDAENRTADIKIGDNVLSVYANNYQHAGKVHVDIKAPDVPHDDRNTYDNAHRTSDAYVSPDARTIEGIAKDIKKRVIDASADALAKQRAYAAEKAQSRNGIAHHIERMRKQFPAMTIRHEERALQAHVSTYNMGGNTFSGTLSADGSVSVDRISGLSADQFAALVKLLSK